MKLKGFLHYTLLIVMAMGVIVSTSEVLAEQKSQPIARAEGEELETAVGHFARARSLLIAAVHEFDRGIKLVDPEAMVDVQRFRSTLLDRSEELERILDPQPRVTRSGVQYSPDVRLLGEANQ